MSEYVYRLNVRQLRKHSAIESLKTSHDGIELHGFDFRYIQRSVVKQTNVTILQINKKRLNRKALIMQPRIIIWLRHGHLA